MKDADKEQYLKRGTLAVLNVMKDLLRYQTLLMVNFSRGQFISRLLAADEDRVILISAATRWTMIWHCRVAK